MKLHSTLHHPSTSSVRGTALGVSCLAMALALSSGCSTIVNHGHPSGVRIESNPPDAQIYVDNVLSGTTPATLRIDGPSRKCRITLKMEGFNDIEAEVSKQIDPWVWGNVPFVVFPVVAAAGIGVDAYSGRWFRYEPSSIKVDFKQGNSIINSPDIQTPLVPGDTPSLPEQHVNAAQSSIPNAVKPPNHHSEQPDSESSEESDPFLQQYLK